MKCGNPYCGGKAEEHVNSRGGGSVYCLDGCGYYSEFPAGTKTLPRRERLDPPPPKFKKPKRVDR